MKRSVVLALCLLSTSVFAKAYVFPARIALAKQGVVVESRAVTFALEEPTVFGGPLVLKEASSGAASKIDYFLYQQLPLLNKNFQFLLGYKGFLKGFQAELPGLCLYTAPAKFSIAEVGSHFKVLGNIGTTSCGGYEIRFCMGKGDADVETAEDHCK